MYDAVLYIAVAYILLFKLNMVTITRNVFINIFQTEHFLAVKFSTGYEKNMGYLVIAKAYHLKEMHSGFIWFLIPICT